MSAEEGTFRTRDGVELFTKTWRAEGTAKARLVFVHGYADHSDAQGKFFPLLAAKGITVFAFDQRGWGRSAIDKAQWGRSGGTEQIMEDLTAFIKSVPNAEEQPLFLMGHSMGGNEVLYYTATGPKDVLSSLRGVIAEAPFIDVAPKSKPLPGLQTISHLLARLVPNMQWPQKVDIGLVSRDPAVVEAIRTDPHVHQLGTVIGLESMLTRGEELEAGKVKIEEGKLEGGKTRLLVLFGDADDVCWHDAAERLVKATQVEDKQFKSYPGWFHKLHDDGSEADKHQFADDVAQWILSRCSQ